MLKVLAPACYGVVDDNIVTTLAGECGVEWVKVFS